MSGTRRGVTSFPITVEGAIKTLNEVLSSVGPHRPLKKVTDDLMADLIMNDRHKPTNRRGSG